jgi:hypothetical protein
MAAMPQTMARIALRAAQLALAALGAAYLLYFADHARQLLAFGYPLDYGEGPLLAQVERLRAGAPVWRLYGDPAVAPYQIVNYPPLYLLLAAALASAVGPTLLAGRLVSLLAALGCALALAALARRTHFSTPNPQPSAPNPLPSSRNLRLPLALLFLTVPVVREWAVLMRVDMLGVCLGLWGLVLARSALDAIGAPGRRRAMARAVAAGLLLLACLFTKPSLIAAPAAAACWLVWRAWRAAGARRSMVITVGAVVLGVVGLGGGLLFGLLQWASGGWFATHVVAANANRWETELAQGFWEQQLALRWPLAVAAALGAGAMIWRREAGPLALPALYTLSGVIVAAGVGKVGAYSNYFLELYAGLVWLVALGAQPPAPGQRHGVGAPGATRPSPAALLPAGFYLLLAAALLYYPPLWDAGRLRPAGLLEPSPPRLAVGRYGLWADAAREAEVLAAQGRVGAALAAEVSAAGPVLLTDMPGVAAGVVSRLQAFEARQLFDQGLADEGPLLHELANGALPLAVIDYLGNWLTPGTIEILQRRYAHDGSVGTFDRYRPVEVGPLRPLALAFPAPGGPLLLSGFGLAAPLGEAYEPGELLALALVWQRDAAAPRDDLSVVVRLATPEGAPLLESERPLLYGAYGPARWPQGAPVQHMQPLELPAELPEGRYALAVGLRAGEAELGDPRIIATLAVSAQGGALEESGYFVPAAFRRAWAELGGMERAGLPLTPAVPFAWGRLQCFERVCLELRGAEVRQRPLGATLYLAETLRSGGCLAGKPLPKGFCQGFAGASERYSDLGEPLGGELMRNGWVVQWTELARLERAPEGGPPGLGRLGDESLRLPPGQPYRGP